MPTFNLVATVRVTASTEVEADSLSLAKDVASRRDVLLVAGDEIEAWIVDEADGRPTEIRELGGAPHEGRETPLLHVGGTPGDRLFGEYAAAAGGLRELIRTLPGPNERDYCVKGNGAFGQAAAEHRARLGKLRDVLAEIEQILESIADQRSVMS